MTETHERLRTAHAPDLALQGLAVLASTLAEDDAILGELRRRGVPPAAEAWFDPIALEEELQRGTDR